MSALSRPRYSLEHDVRARLELACECTAIDATRRAEGARRGAHIRRVVLWPVEQVESIKAQFYLYVLIRRDVFLHIGIPVARVVLAQQVLRESAIVFRVGLNIRIVRIGR